MWEGILRVFFGTVTKTSIVAFVRDLRVQCSIEGSVENVKTFTNALKKQVKSSENSKIGSLCNQRSIIYGEIFFSPSQRRVTLHIFFAYLKGMVSCQFFSHNEIFFCIFCM